VGVGLAPLPRLARLAKAKPDVISLQELKAEHPGSFAFAVAVALAERRLPNAESRFLGRMLTAEGRLPLFSPQLFPGPVLARD